MHVDIYKTLLTFYRLRPRMALFPSQDGCRIAHCKSIPGEVTLWVPFSCFVLYYYWLDLQRAQSKPREALLPASQGAPARPAPWPDGQWAFMILDRDSQSAHDRGQDSMWPGWEAPELGCRLNSCKQAGDRYTGTGQGGLPVSSLAAPTQWHINNL